MLPLQLQSSGARLANPCRGINCYESCPAHGGAAPAPASKHKEGSSYLNHNTLNRKASVSEWTIVRVQRGVGPLFRALSMHGGFLTVA